MTALPKVTVIQCNYNHGRYLRQCFASVLQQKYPNFEICLTDDGSTDDSRAIIEEHAARDSRIKPVYFAKNQGIGAAAREALSHATGDLIMTLASDDFLISPDFFSDSVEGLTQHPQAALFYGVCGIYEDETNKLVGGMGTATVEGYNSPLQCCRGYLQYRSVVTSPSTIYRMDLYRKHGGTDTDGSLFRDLGPQIDYYVNHNLAFRYGVVYRKKPYACQRVFQKQSNFSARPNLWQYAARMGRMEQLLREAGVQYPGIELDWERWRAFNTQDMINKTGVLNMAPAPE